MILSSTAAIAHRTIVDHHVLPAAYRTALLVAVITRVAVRFTHPAAVLAKLAAHFGAPLHVGNPVDMVVTVASWDAAGHFRLDLRVTRADGLPVVFVQAGLRTRARWSAGT
ncbi:MAG: hypothetical protein NVS4B8_28330 [Herpetosiphon sp.]